MEIQKFFFIFLLQYNYILLQVCQILHSYNSSIIVVKQLFKRETFFFKNHFYKNIKNILNFTNTLPILM